ncbi:hypothetical protein [Paenibacillus kribbensis]|uniref:hypothetical protein n=1 Tax=Paenibacillus kribbensis TaxID=172713 RepID=UPI0012FDF629|nr:hypothetical protein [Paenibacillus kribbensis]
MRIIISLEDYCELLNIRVSACLFLISLMLVLSACATSGNGSAVVDGQTADFKTASTSDTIATRTYESDKGTVTLPEHPQRVVVAVGDYVGDVLALGVTPVGAPDPVFNAPYYKKYLNGVENITRIDYWSWAKC